MGEMRMATTVPGALREAEVRRARHVVDSLGREITNRLRQALRIIRNLDQFRNFRFRLFGGVQHMLLMFDQRPLE